MASGGGDMPHLTGYLEKQRPRAPLTWQRRWFVLVYGELVYYRSEEAPAPLKRIPLGDVVDITTNPEKKHVILHLQDKVMKLRCADDAEIQRWKEAFEKSKSLVRAKLASSEPVDKPLAAEEAPAETEASTKTETDAGAAPEGSTAPPAEPTASPEPAAAPPGRRKSVVDAMKDMGHAAASAATKAASKSKKGLGKSKSMLREHLSVMHAKGTAVDDVPEMVALVQGIKPSAEFYKAFQVSFAQHHMREMSATEQLHALGEHLGRVDVDFEPSDLGRLLLAYGQVADVESKLLHGEHQKEEGEEGLAAQVLEALQGLVHDAFPNVVDRRSKYKDARRKMAARDETAEKARRKSMSFEEGGSERTKSGSEDKAEKKAEKEATEAAASAEHAQKSMHAAREWLLHSAEGLDQSKIALGDKLFQLLVARRKYHEASLVAIDKAMAAMAAGAEAEADAAAEAATPEPAPAAPEPAAAAAPEPAPPTDAAAVETVQGGKDAEAKEEAPPAEAKAEAEAEGEAAKAEGGEVKGAEGEAAEGEQPTAEEVKAAESAATDLQAEGGEVKAAE